MGWSDFIGFSILDPRALLRSHATSTARYCRAWILRHLRAISAFLDSRRSSVPLTYRHSRDITEIVVGSPQRGAGSPEPAVGRAESVQIEGCGILPGAIVGHRRRVDAAIFTKPGAPISNRETNRLETGATARK